MRLNLINLIRASGAAALLLWGVSPALAQGHGSASPGTRCENAKLRAASAYTSCLVRTVTRDNLFGQTPLQDEFARCNDRFDRAFSRAEAGGACHTVGGAATLREEIATQVKKTVHLLSAGLNCAITAGEKAVCQVDKGTTALDIEAAVKELSGVGVTDDTIFWIQAWGGDGSDGNVCCSYGGRGGQGGYAQTTTTVNTMETQYSTTELHYYLGVNGTFQANSGGDGGTATMVTTNDVTATDLMPDFTLLIAGGGGGGGAGRGSSTACNGTETVHGEAGGNGAMAVLAPISGVGSTGAATIVAGQDGGGSHSGQGGQLTSGGTAPDPASPGSDPISPLGGRGGNHTDSTPQIGFVNATLSNLTGGGQGADGGNNAGGGGGGGGYTGGGGGNRGYHGTACTSGGGGGGSSVAREVPDSPDCSAAVPDTRPANPNGGQGFVQITFDLGMCESLNSSASASKK